MSPTCICHNIVCEVKYNKEQNKCGTSVSLKFGGGGFYLASDKYVWVALNVMSKCGIDQIYEHTCPEEVTF